MGFLGNLFLSERDSNLVFLLIIAANNQAYAYGYGYGYEQPADENQQPQPEQAPAQPETQQSLPPPPPAAAAVSQSPVVGVTSPQKPAASPAQPAVTTTTVTKTQASSYVDPAGYYSETYVQESYYQSQQYGYGEQAQQQPQEQQHPQTQPVVPAPPPANVTAVMSPKSVMSPPPPVSQQQQHQPFSSPVSRASPALSYQQYQPSQQAPSESSRITSPVINMTVGNSPSMQHQQHVSSLPEFIFCTQCAKKNDFEANFCCKCGTKLKRDDFVSAPSPVGSQYSQSQPPQQQATPTQPLSQPPQTQHQQQVQQPPVQSQNPYEYYQGQDYGAYGNTYGGDQMGASGYGYEQQGYYQQPQEQQQQQPMVVQPVAAIPQQPPAKSAVEQAYEERRYAPHPVVCLGFGRIAYMLPKKHARFIAGSTGPVEKWYPSEVNVCKTHEICSSKSTNSLEKWIGPLVNGKRNRKKEVLKELDDLIKALAADNTYVEASPAKVKHSERVLLWKIVRVIIDQDGSLYKA